MQAGKHKLIMVSDKGYKQLDRLKKAAEKKQKRNISYGAIIDALLAQAKEVQV